MTEILIAITTWISALVTPIPLNEQDVYCLTRNAYYEAKGDSQMSQIAVTHVVLNRMNSEGFPKKACDVVYQKNKNPESKHVVCQFSWTCDRKLMAKLPDEENSVWRESLAAVEKALTMYYHRRVDVTEGSTFYHANYVNPRWSGVEKVTTIGSHIYYRTSEKCQNNQKECSQRSRSRT